MSEILTAVQKAFALNLDPDLYGSIAEIGAGQEVARYFFLAGLAGPGFCFLYYFVIFMYFWRKKC